ncbi:MAG: hypothetical protein CMD81_07995 [Gammaproteobacteria bacterium]|nr:hypothetical protein [Gammaproteobacteria bacterium]MBK82289.1 hypothetical protein [Gammaproteobacteria bacterium]MBK83758.1 hypothetical protein [Gammaproteobacteria bacterium]HCV02075.1 hypothetical protein [Pseudoalteromonas sp.]|tara:strand:- start:3136 stop:3711 length:576 start_codon:yes stop_codon:yes gene_type:complete
MSDINHLVRLYRGEEEFLRYSSFELSSPKYLLETAKSLLNTIPPFLGGCALLSAVWADELKTKFNIPAIVVAGHLSILGKRLFECKSNIPTPNAENQFSDQSWDGHCWIEIDGFIGDLSIFRTAYNLNFPNIFTEYIKTNFGLGRGALITPYNEIPCGIEYEAKYILTDNQIHGLAGGLWNLVASGKLFMP